MTTSHQPPAPSKADDVEALAEVLTEALRATETAGGWWGRPECEEFGRLIAPRVAAHVRARVAVVDARLAAVEALFVPDGDYAPCDQATWACPHTECEVAVAVLAALHSDPSEAKL